MLTFKTSIVGTLFLFCSLSGNAHFQIQVWGGGGGGLTVKSYHDVCVWLNIFY